MEKKVIHIAHAIDAAAAHHAAKEVASSIGFNPQACEEIAIAVSELATNQYTHAKGGQIVIEPIAGERAGILVEALDTGPGFADLEQALADGFSSTGGLGLGLGSVNRLMDQFEVQSLPGQGARITCKRWLHPELAEKGSPRLDIGVATRPLPGTSVNGDSFVIKQWKDHALVGVIDGLGHGQLASLASTAARQFIETHPDQPLEALFRGTARACLATRGVVMALAQFDFAGPAPDGEHSPDSPAGRFLFASVGNIEVRLLGARADFKLRRGIIGPSAPNAPVTEHRWTRESLLILHSDGLTTRWQPQDFPNLAAVSASEAAQELLNSLAKDNDDATVMVVKSRRKDGAG